VGYRCPLSFSCLAAAAFALACDAAHPDGPSAPPRLSTAAAPVTPTRSTGAAPPEPPSSGVAPATEPTTIVADPDVLARLEGLGFDAGTLLVGARASTTAELAEYPAYRTLRDAVVADLSADRRSDRQAGVGMRFAHRQFDARWLQSSAVRLVLVGVVNRLDRKVFAPEHCGEVRFVYRLAYATETPAGPIESRLAMTVNVVSFMPASGSELCRDTARAWLRPVALGDPLAQTAWLVGSDGPLSPARRAAFVPKSVELNFQSVRWPSTVRPAMAGHAEYVLRVFHRVPNAPYFVPAPLENTVDVQRIRREPALARQLTEFLAAPDTLRAVDAGTVLVPERFLALRAVSVTPHGLARRANRPYASALDPETLTASLEGYETIGTRAALLRRLDELSCPGCHQSRSIAGFHLLGVEPAGDRVDALEVPMSAHLHADLERRRAYVAAVASGAVPDERRPPAERGLHDDGEGARCGLGDPGFARWTCAAGLACARESDAEIGVCMQPAGPAVGDACESGVIAPSADGRADRMTLGAPASCQGGRVCEANSVGFPDGMCAGGCEALPKGAACGGIPLLAEFNGCIAAGTPFERCIADNTRPAALRGCSFHVPCRDDYVCARAPTGGVCMPPYFLFQLRVDGHPL